MCFLRAEMHCEVQNVSVDGLTDVIRTLINEVGVL